MDREVVGKGYKEDSLEYEDLQYAIENLQYWTYQKKKIQNIGKRIESKEDAWLWFK